MKVKIMLLIVAITMCFVACAKDDDEPTKQQTIIGTWSGPGHWEDTWTYTFRTDGTYTEYYIDSEYPDNATLKDGTYSISGNMITMEYEWDVGYGASVSEITTVYFYLSKDSKGEYLILGPFKLYRI